MSISSRIFHKEPSRSWKAQPSRIKITINHPFPRSFCLELADHFVVAILERPWQNVRPQNLKISTAEGLSEIFKTTRGGISRISGSTLPQTPAVLSGAMDDWMAMKLWNLPVFSAVPWLILATVMGDQLVTIRCRWSQAG